MNIKAQVALGDLDGDGNLDAAIVQDSFARLHSQVSCESTDP